MVNEIKTITSKLTPMGTFHGRKEGDLVRNVKNSDSVYTKKSDKKNEEKKFSLNNANNYVYLGSTNTPLLNNMGITLADDGSLILIKGKTHDLFTGLYQKHFKGGFKYNVFNIESQNGDNMKFKELYVDQDGFLIGSKRNESNSENINELYKIEFNKMQYEYDLNSDLPVSDNCKFIINYEQYIIPDELKHDLSNINNVVELKEKNILKINREGLDVTMEIKDNQLVTTGLPATIEPCFDQVDSKNIAKHKIKLPLGKNDKILAIKPILNQVQLVVDKGNKIKIYYLNPLNIFAIKNYQYEVTRLKQEPPLYFYSEVGENNYRNYHSGQPFSTQTVGNFSSRHIPFFSSYIDNVRIQIDVAKQKYALKKYNEMCMSFIKSIDPGFRETFSSIKKLTNSVISFNKNKNIILHKIKKDMQKSYSIINKHIKGIHNGKTQGEIIYSLVDKLKTKELIIINNYNDLRAFFGINAFSFLNKNAVNAFLLTHYEKIKSIIISKNEKNEITFSFINKSNANISMGLSAGITSFDKTINNNGINYGILTPFMASLYFHLNVESNYNFSLKVQLEDVEEFINNGLRITEDQLKYKSTLETNNNLQLSLGAEIRSEGSVNVDVSVNQDTNVTVPRNAIGANAALKLLKLNVNVNKFIEHGQVNTENTTKNIIIDFFEMNAEFYRDLKFTPSTTRSGNNIQWYPLASLKNFETMIQKKINSLFKIPIFDSKERKDKEEFERNKMELKGIYKRVLKINKLFDKYPSEYDVTGNINKLDKIYLSLTSNKKLKDKLGQLSNDKKIQNSIEESVNIKNKEQQVNLFLSNLKERKVTLASQEKDNMNEKFKPYIISKYKLDKESQIAYNNIRIKVKTVLETVQHTENMKLNDIKNLLDGLYKETKEILNKIEYQIDAIDVMSISELADQDKSLPLIFLQIGSKKSISHQQVKGEIKFLYDESNHEPQKISADYYF